MWSRVVHVVLGRSSLAPHQCLCTTAACNPHNVDSKGCIYFTPCSDCSCCVCWLVDVSLLVPPPPSPHVPHFCCWFSSNPSLTCCAGAHSPRGKRSCTRSWMPRWADQGGVWVGDPQLTVHLPLVLAVVCACVLSSGHCLPPPSIRATSPRSSLQLCCTNVPSVWCMW